MIDDGYIVIDDGLLADVGSGPAPGGAEVVDLAGCAVVPALINAHTHIADSAIKEVGFGLDEWTLLMPPDGVKHRMLAALDRDVVVESMRASMRLMLRTGTVAFSDFREQGVPGVEALNEAQQGLPITAITMGRFATLPPHSEDDLRRNEVGLPAGYREELEAILDVASGFSFVTANDTTDEGLSEAAKLVRDRGKRLAVHVAENERYREISISRTGKSDVIRAIEHLCPDFVVHMTTANEEELDAVAEAEIQVVVCGRVQATLANGVPPLRALHSRRIEYALATDNVMLANPNLLDELKYMARGPRAVSRDPSFPAPRDLLAGVTTVAARALRIDDELGSLVPGKSASFIVFDLRTDNLHPVRDILASLVTRADAADIAAVVHRGELVSGALPGAVRCQA